MSEEYINIYITNKRKGEEWKNMIENHYVDPKRETTEREIRLANYLLMKAKEKGYERLEDYDKEAYKYIAHVPSMQFMVTEKYGSKPTNEIAYNASVLVVGFENIWPMAKLSESMRHNTPMNRDLREVMKTGETPYLMFSLCAVDKNPRNTAKIMDEMFEIASSAAKELDKDNVIHMVVANKEVHTCISNEEDMRKYLDSLYTKGIPDLSADKKDNSKPKER